MLKVKITNLKKNGTKNLRQRNINLIVILCWILLASVGFYFTGINASGKNFTANPAVEETNFTEGESGFEVVEAPAFAENAQNFSRYSHTIGAHSSLSCLMCHRRDTNAARPSFPGHSPCAGCHAQEFNKPAGESPICTICHTSSGTAAMKTFPGLRSFTVKFSHTVHSRARANCATCHSAAGRAASARSIPSGLAAHNTCFQCHTSRAMSGGRDISSCATCHTLGRFARTPNPSRAYNVGFNHNTHRTMSCNQCHTVSGGARGNQVSEPVAAMHFPPARAQSCATCHNNRRAFGGDDFSDCKRCHKGTRFGL